MALKASSSDRPMACRTWDGSGVPALQADPLDAAMPSRSSWIKTVSAVIPGKPALVMWGARGAPAPWIRAPGIRARIPSSSRLCRLASRTARRGCSRAASSAARPNPAMAAVFSVPERSRRSWPPPSRRGSKAVPART